jgi:undecaprenyl diphosphate synthase
MPADLLPEIPSDRRPKHIAIIMDGNGRWAQARRLPRIEGHRKGAGVVRRTLEACQQLGVSHLTLFCFSTENWKRPASELDFLMGMLKRYLADERANLRRHGIALHIIGRREGLPPEVLEEMDRSVDPSLSDSQTHLTLAINYGARQELVDAVRQISSEVAAGRLAAEAIDERVISQHLYTAGLPDPDLLIRTSGEMRISNFLLWQISYAELWITEKLWPEFSTQDLVEAVRHYAGRQRRFGGLQVADAAASTADSCMP